MSTRQTLYFLFHIYLVTGYFADCCIRNSHLCPQVSLLSVGVLSLHYKSCLSALQYLTNDYLDWGTDRHTTSLPGKWDRRPCSYDWNKHCVNDIEQKTHLLSQTIKISVADGYQALFFMAGRNGLKFAEQKWVWHIKDPQDTWATKTSVAFWVLVEQEARKNWLSHS